MDQSEERHEAEEEEEEEEEDSPDPLQGSVGMSALWATIAEATLSPSAHMALLDGPAQNTLKSGHSADAFIQRDLILVHLSEERETIYGCRYSKDVHRTNSR